MKYFLSLLIVLLTIVSCASTPKQRTDKLSILQGITSTKEVEFNVLGQVGRTFKFELRSAEGAIVVPEEVKTITHPYSSWMVYKLLFLRDQTKEYNLYVFENNKIIDQRLVGKGQINQSRLKIAVVSCIDDAFQEHFKIWNALVAKNPEYVLMIGDNVYADREINKSAIKSTPETLWRRYLDVRLTIPFFFQEKLIPVHAVWDDHDFGSNNASEEFEYKNESKEVFESFFAQSLSEENYTKGFGVGGLLSMGDFNLYFLDGRTFRSTKPEGSHLGQPQTDWLIQSLKEESQPSLIIKGDQFFGGYQPFESFEGKHPNDFVAFVDRLRALGTPFVFLSGDRHMSEIMQFPRSLFGLPSFEITSSPMHGKVYPPSDSKNPWRVVRIEGKVNFTFIDNLSLDNYWFMDVENIGENGELYYRRELAVYIKDLQNNLNEVRKRRRSGVRRYRKSRARRR